MVEGYSNPEQTDPRQNQTLQFMNVNV